MAEHHTEPWYPTAAYLYTLHLNGPALAWEYPVSYTQLTLPTTRSV